MPAGWEPSLGTQSIPEKHSWHLWSAAGYLKTRDILRCHYHPINKGKTQKLLIILERWKIVKKVENSLGKEDSCWLFQMEEQKNSMEKVETHLRQ